METTRRIGILVAVQKLRLHTSPCARDGAEEIAILSSSVADASRITSRYLTSVFKAFLVGEVVVWGSSSVAKRSKAGARAEINVALHRVYTA
jgi:hypothetical protein